MEVKSSFNLAPVNLVEVIFTLCPAQRKPPSVTNDSQTGYITRQQCNTKIETASPLSKKHTNTPARRRGGGGAAEDEECGSRKTSK